MTASLVEPRTVTEEEARPRSAWTRLQTMGLGLVACAPLTIMLAELLLQGGIGPVWMVFVTVAAVTGLAAVLVSRFGTWAKVVGLVVTVLVAVMAARMVLHIAYPSSPGDFVPALLLLVGLPLALVAGVAGIVARRRGRTAGDSAPAEGRIARVVVAVIAVASLGSVAAGLLGGPAAATGDADLTVTMAEFAFDADAYTVAADEPTTVRVRNDDGFVHTFTIPELGIDQTVLPGGEALVEVTAPAGTYTLYCAPHADLSEPDPTAAGMATRLVAE